VDDIVRWENKFKEQVFFVMTEGDFISGFTSLKQSNYIDHLYVSHLHLGKDIASQLMIM